MLKTLIKQSILSKRVQWLTYAGIGAAFLILYMLVFPSVQQQAANYDQIVNSLPKGVLSAFGITETDPSLMGYLASKHFGFVWALMIILLAGSFGASAIAREIESRTMGFLLSAPVSRTRLYLSRWLAGLIGIAFFVAVSELTVYPLSKLWGYDIQGVDVINLALLGLVFGAAVLGLALLISARTSEGSRVSALLGGLLLIMYVAYLVASLEPKLELLQYLSIFHYFTPGTVVFNDQIKPGDFLVLLAVAAGAGAGGLYIFQRRDIQV